MRTTVTQIDTHTDKLIIPLFLRRGLKIALKINKQKKCSITYILF